MRKVIRKAITMIMVCVMTISISMPVSAADECPHGMYHDESTIGRSILNEHMNGTCTIYKVYRKVEIKCIFCGYVTQTSIIFIGDEHSFSHP